MTNHTSEIKDHTFLVTGSAGFIGYHVAQTLLAHGARVVGLDNFNDYYSPALKHDRDRELPRYPNFFAVAADLTDLPALEALVPRRPAPENLPSGGPGRGAVLIGQSLCLPEVQPGGVPQSPGTGQTLPAGAPGLRLQFQCLCRADGNALQARNPHGWTRPSASMRPPKRPTSSWPIPTAICSAFLPWD